MTTTDFSDPYIAALSRKIEELERQVAEARGETAARIEVSELTRQRDVAYANAVRLEVQVAEHAEAMEFSRNAIAGALQERDRREGQVTAMRIDLARSVAESAKALMDAGAVNQRLRTAIAAAPHQMGCTSLQGGPDTEGWGLLEHCNCWKGKAMGSEP